MFNSKVVWAKSFICNGKLMDRLLNIENLSIACSEIDNKNENILLQFFRDKKKTKTLLRDVNLSVFKGEYLGLVGESGCGKSLTMKSIFGMIDIDPGIVNGKISINDSNNNIVNILDTDNRKIIKTFLSSTYFRFIHKKIKDNLLEIPSIFKIDKELIILLYNDLGAYRKFDIPKDGGYNIELDKDFKEFTHIFILGRTFIPIDNKKNIKEITNASKKNKLPGKFVSIILQDPISFLNPHWSMIKQIDNLKGLHPSNETNDVDTVLTNLKLNSKDFKSALPREISGGQGQRAMIVLSSLTQPKLLIADEPTTGLDVTLKKIVVEKFKDLKNQISDDFSMIFISHDLNMVRRATDRMNVMYRGIVIENGLSKDFINPDNHHPYTSKLINITQSNFSTSYASDEEDIDLSYQGGCSYYELCEHVLKDEKCANISPPPISIKDNKILINEDPTISWIKCWAFLGDDK